MSLEQVTRRPERRLEGNGARRLRVQSLTIFRLSTVRRRRTLGKPEFCEWQSSPSHSGVPLLFPYPGRLCKQH